MSVWFLAPWFLAGTVVALIPVVLHLIYRKRAPRIEFPTIRFLVISVKRTAHRRRIQELLLLLLRAGALFLLAVGLAGPFVRSGGLLGKGETTLALILDNSYSMAAVSEGQSRYARAKEMAGEIVRELGASSKVALIFTNRRPREDDGSVGGTPTMDRERVVSEIEASEVSAADGDMGAAFARAQEVLEQTPNPNREIYILSDLQKVAWKNLPQAKLDASQFPVVVLDCSTTGYRNLAVTGAAVRSKGRATDIPLTIEAVILNATERPESNVSVSLYIENVRRRHRTIDLGPRASTTVSFQETFKTPGVRTGWVQIDSEDSLAYDNKRHFSVDVSERIPVLVVEDEEGAIPLLDALFYLVPALDPAEAGAVQVRSVIQPTRLLRASLPKAQLARYAVVFLVDCTELTTPETRALADYVARGGCVVVFPGERVKASVYNKRSKEVLTEHGGLLPAELGKTVGSPDDREHPVRLSELDFDHLMMAPFRGLPRAVFESVNIYRYVELGVPQGSSARVLAWMDNGKPFLVHRGVARGQVFLFCTTATTAWANFPIRVLFLPMMHQLVYYVVGSREEASLLAGAPKLFPPDGKGRTPVLEVSDPLGRRFRTGHTDDPKQEAVGPARFGRTFARGIYRWRTVEGPERQGAFVVNANARESELGAYDRKSVEKLFGERPVYFARDAIEAKQLATRLRKGVQLWNLALFIVVGIAVAECFLANRHGAAERPAHPMGKAA